MTVPIFKLSNQIEPFYLQYSSHTDGHNSRYVDTTATLRTPDSVFGLYLRHFSLFLLNRRKFDLANLKGSRMPPSTTARKNSTTYI